MKRLLLSVLATMTLGSAVLTYGAITSASAVGAAASQIILAQQQSQAVTIQNFAFSPASLTVAPGTTVTWTNKDSTAHTVTADSGTGPNSGQIMPGQSYSFTYQQPGTYAYHCSIHPQMKATVVVSSSSSSGTTQPPTGGTGAGAPPQQQTQPQNNQAASGPVEAGSGAVATSRPWVTPVALGVLVLAGAAALLVVRRSHFAHR